MARLRLLEAAAVALCLFGLSGTARADTVVLGDIDSGTTSPTGERRWLDIANQAYGGSFREDYDYTLACVTVEYAPVGAVLAGTLTAANLKPFFAYQLKLVGTPGTSSNERIGLAGRWWQQVWLGTAWSNGGNLNNKGDGSSPNPNDEVYFQRRDIEDPTSRLFVVPRPLSLVCGCSGGWQRGLAPAKRAAVRRCSRP